MAIISAMTLRTWLVSACRSEQFADSRTGAVSDTRENSLPPSRAISTLGFRLVPAGLPHLLNSLAEPSQAQFQTAFFCDVPEQKGGRCFFTRGSASKQRPWRSLPW